MQEQSESHPSTLLDKVRQLEETIRELEHRQEFAGAVLDSMAAHVAVIDASGQIIAVNESWRRFARLNHAGQSGRVDPGANYLEICRTAMAAGSEEARTALSGIENVLARRIHEFTCEYPCQAPGRENWYLMRVFPLARESGGAVISHVDITARKQAEREREKLHAQFQESNRLLETVLDSIPDIIGVQGPDHRVIRYNAAGYLFLSQTSESIRNKRCFELIGRDRCCDECATSIAYRTKSPARVERYFPETGTWLDVRAYPILDESGAIVQVVEHLRDITREKQTEADLRSRIDFESLVTGISTRFINLRAEQLDAGINEAMGAIGRFAAADRSYVFRFRDGNRRMDNTHEWCAPGIESHRQRLQDLAVADFPSVAGPILSGQVRHIPNLAMLPPSARAEKEEFEREGIKSILLVPMICAGDVVGFLGFDSVRAERTWPDNLIALLRIASEIIANGLARKSSEETLRQSESKFRTLFNGAADAIFIHDLQGLILEVNTVATERYGYSREELLRLSPSEVDTVSQSAQVENRIRAVLEKGELIFESEHRRRDGTFFPVEVNARLVAYDAELAVLSICRDISVRKELEIQLRHQERVAAIGRMAGGIAHDFNNLLTGIIGIAEMLQYESDITATVKSDIALIEVQGKKAAHLIRQILDYTRQSAAARSPLDLLPLCAEAAGFLRRTLPENIQIRFQTEPGQYLVNTDPVQIQQVLTNLSVNAKDSMPSGGELGIHLSSLNLDAGAPAPLPGLTPGDWVVLSISDTGTGIHPDVLGHIFDPFFTTKGVGQGSGLGLAQVYGIVQQHQGFIGVETSLEHGSTFRVYLPRLLENGGPPPKPSPHDPPAGHGETILFVEDEEVVRLLGQQILTRLGYRVIPAANGLEALAAHESAGQVDLLVTDLIMPRMDGADLIRELRRRDPGLKVIAITGYAVAKDLRQLAGCGISEIIHKPFDIKRLAISVRQLLDERS